MMIYLIQGFFKTVNVNFSTANVSSDVILGFLSWVSTQIQLLDFVFGDTVTDIQTLVSAWGGSNAVVNIFTSATLATLIDIMMRRLKPIIPVLTPYSPTDFWNLKINFHGWASWYFSWGYHVTVGTSIAYPQPSVNFNNFLNKYPAYGDVSFATSQMDTNLGLSSSSGGGSTGGGGGTHYLT